VRRRSILVAIALASLALALLWAFGRDAGPVRDNLPTAGETTLPALEAGELEDLPSAGVPEASPPPAQPAAPTGPDPDAAAGTVRMRVDPKLAGEPLSEVPHRVLGAWDDQPDAPDAGPHRVFVLVVDPDLSTGRLEALVRDIRDRHRDAEVLDVRVYGAEATATGVGHGTAGEGGAGQLLANVKRNDRLGYDEISVRGVELSR
jgi:hypothetical protein